MSVAYPIREAKASDAAAVVVLFGVLDDLHTAGAPHQFRGSSAKPRSEQIVLDLVNDPNAVILVAEGDARLVGFVTARIEEIPDRSPLVSRRYVHVHDLVVTADMRRRGIGQALVRAVERWADARGLSSVELTVWEFNEEARSMYDGLGYATQHRRLRRVLPGSGSR